MLIINADDFGMNTSATDCSLECCRQGRVTSVSAMVFMGDSERGAELALGNGLEVGLHLNFTTSLDNAKGAPEAARRQQRIASYLTGSKYLQLVPNPLLANDFEYVFKAQYDEFLRLYRKMPTHIDGHHHMHLCANMLTQQLIPRGFKTRRGFSFFQGEKTYLKRLYRSLVDSWWLRRHVSTDYFFDIRPLGDRSHIRHILDLAQESLVEVMFHPQRPDEYAFAMSEEYGRLLHGVELGSYRDIPVQ